MAQTRPNNSTNVRFFSDLTSDLLAVSGTVAPRLVASWAAGRFFTPRRHVRPRWESALLARARRGEVSTPDGVLPTWTWGSGPSVVLAHGWEGRGSQLGAFVEPFVEAGRSVVAFDAPAHGDAPGRTSSIVDMARALTLVATQLPGVEAVVAHSLGAAASMVALARAKLAGKAVFVAPPLSAAPWAGAFSSALGLPPAVATAFHREVVSRLGVPVETIDARVLRPLGEVATLVVHDTADREVSVDLGRQVASAWGAALYETSGLGHRRILRSALVLDEVVRFVTGRVRVPALAALEEELFCRELRWVA